MTTRMGAPQVGQRAARGGGGLRGGGWPSRGCPCPIIRRMVVSGMPQLAWSKPKWRTFMKPSGKTCWRNRRRNSMTSSWAVCGRDDAVVGDGDLEDIRGEIGEGGVAVVIGLTVDVPGKSPGLRIDLLQQTGVAHLFFEDGAVDGGERFDRDKEVGPGGPPGRAVLGEAPTRDNVVDVGVVLELPAPGVQDPGEPREIGPNKALVGGETFESRCRRLKQGLVREALMRADEGSERLRDGKGEEEVWPGQLLLQVVCEPLLGLMLLTLGAVAIAAGMLDAVLPPTVWALIEAVAVVSALAVLDGADDLAVGEGQLGVALQVLGRKGGEDSAEGRHDRSLPS